MADINIGAIAEQLNYKVDLDMHNSEKPYIVETYDDGNGNGYILWSNKFCIQYFRHAVTTGTSVISTLFIEMRDTFYGGSRISESQSTDNQNLRGTSFFNRTTTSFESRCWQPASYDFIFGYAL